MFHSDQIQNGDGRGAEAREGECGGIKRKKKIGWLHADVQLINRESKHSTRLLTGGTNSNLKNS